MRSIKRSEIFWKVGRHDDYCSSTKRLKNFQENFLDRLAVDGDKSLVEYLLLLTCCFAELLIREFFVFRYHIAISKCRENNKISVTRFGEISPIWQNFKTIWQLVEGSISVWQTFEAIWENSMCFRANLRCFKWPNIEQTF